MINVVETPSLTPEVKDTAPTSSTQIQSNFDQAALAAMLNAASKVAQGIVLPMIVQNLKDSSKS